jgi:hypothetical protein
MKRLIILVAVVAVAACHKGGGAVHGAAPLSPTGKMLSDLSVFALGHPLPVDEIAAKEKDVVAGKLKVEDYIDALLKQPMGPRLSKDIVMGATSPVKDRHPIPVHSILRTVKDGDDKIYTLREKCTRAEAVSVHPWWDPEKEVLVCKTAYRPDVKGDDSGRTCGASMLAPRDVDLCGCGPYLMYCTESHEAFQRAQDRMLAEVQETAAYVVDGNKPIEELFTMNETVRNNDAEFLYRRGRVANGEDPAKLFPVTGFGDYKGKLMPRYEEIPGQHAGVLSTPALTYSSDALRGVMRNYYDYLWCSGVQSSRVSTDSVLGLGTVDLRVGDGWKKLASMNICTDCHARLDYGMQFFWGYPSSTMGIDFRKSQALKGQGPLYRRNIKDEIGKADLTPAGFAKLATSVPEFGDCMTRRVVDHVFNGTDSSKDYAAVRETFDQTHRIKEMLRTAMTRFAVRKDAPPPKSDGAATVAAAPATTADKIALSPALQKMIKRDCKECHDKDDELNLLVPELDRKTLAMMIDRVGFGAMPKNTEGLDDAERRAFVTEVARHLFADAGERDIATSYFSYGMKGLPVHRFFSAVNNITATAATFAPEPSASDDDKKKKRGGLKGFRPSTIESSIAQSMMSYSPSVALSTAVSAMRTCKEAGLKGDALAHCVDEASAPDVVVTGAVPHEGG